jgi:hypothetical protein
VVTGSMASESVTIPLKRTTSNWLTTFLVRSGHLRDFDPSVSESLVLSKESFPRFLRYAHFQNPMAWVQGRPSPSLSDRGFEIENPLPNLGENLPMEP